METLDLWKRSQLPRSLFRDMWGVLDELDRNTTERHHEATMPLACDIAENDHAFIISFDAPGMKREDIHLELTGRQLTVSGERKREDEFQAGQARRWERSYGKFLRTFELPDGVNGDGVEASYENGVLKVAVPKAEASKTKKIAISDTAKGFLQQLKQKIEPKVMNS